MNIKIHLLSVLSNSHRAKEPPHPALEAQVGGKKKKTIQARKIIMKDKFPGGKGQG